MLADLGAASAGRNETMRRRWCARGSRDDSSGWQVDRQLGALWSTGLRQGQVACGSHGRRLGDLGSPGAATGSKQASGQTKQAGSMRQGLTGLAAWCGRVAELRLRLWWSGGGVRTGKSR